MYIQSINKYYIKSKYTNYIMMQDLDMELLILSTLLLLTLVLSFSLRIFYKSMPKEFNKSSNNNLPPGRTGWPVLGETLEFLSMGRKGWPENFFTKRMEKYSHDVFKTSLLGEKTAVLCGPSGHKFLYSNENKLVTSWWPSNVEKIFPTSLQTSTKEESKKMRKLLPGFLKPDSLVNYISVMDSIAAKHLDTHWESRDEVTVLPLAKQYTFAVACRLFLSIDDPEKIARFEKPFQALVAGVLSIPIDLIGTPFNRAIKAANVIRKELLELIRHRRQPCFAQSCNDILAHMLTTTDENGKFMSELDIADKIIGLLIGGHDTASGAITFIVKYLAELPQVYDRVLLEQNEVAKSKSPGELLNWEDMQKMKYSWNVACEVLRLAPPLQGSFREAITDFNYAGYFIPKGWKLYWTANTTHKNPEYFSEPERFDPSRFEDNGPIPYTYVPFGGGPRMCPGKEYARLEILAFMYNVVRKYKWEKIIPEEKMIVDPMPMPENGLPIRLYKN